MEGACLADVRSHGSEPTRDSLPCSYDDKLYGLT
jgi:hypothetical protein